MTFERRKRWGGRLESKRSFEMRPLELPLNLDLDLDLDLPTLAPEIRSRE